MIRLDSVTKVYSSTVRIGSIDLEIPKAGITSIIGPNGAGKSTMLLMIGRLLNMDEGEISIAGLDVKGTKSTDLAKVIAILRQENHFMTKLTVRQLVGFGRFPYSKGRLTKKDEEIVDKYIAFLGLDELQDRYLNQLSGGQRQRACVAMVLAQETEYVLLDEPLNNLDVARSVQMMKHLRKASNQFGRTIVLVLHDINFAAQYSDSICMMKDGQIAAFGTPEEVMNPELLTNIFDTDVDIVDCCFGKLAVY